MLWFISFGLLCLSYCLVGCLLEVLRLVLLIVLVWYCILLCMFVIKVYYLCSCDCGKMFWVWAGVVSLLFSF